MKPMIGTLSENKLQWLMVLLAMVMLVALMIPGLAWADHASDDSESQYDASAELSPEQFHQWLTQQFIDGKLVRYPPGR